MTTPSSDKRQSLYDILQDKSIPPTLKPKHLHHRADDDRTCNDDFFTVLSNVAWRFIQAWRTSPEHARNQSGVRRNIAFPYNQFVQACPRPAQFFGQSSLRHLPQEQATLPVHLAGVKWIVGK